MILVSRNNIHSGSSGIVVVDDAVI